MRNMTLAVLGLALGLVASARADEWSKTFQVTGKPELAIQTSDANIHVDTWDQNTIAAHVTTENQKIGDGGIKIIEHQSGDSVDIEVRFPHEVGLFNLGHHRVEIDVHMPREGRVNLHTGDGSIQLSHLKGDMQMLSGDGHLEIDEVEGTLRAHTGDGYIRAVGRFEALDATTGDGRIDARVLSGSTMASSWKLRTGDGSVALQLPEEFKADVDLHTGDGHITLDLPFAVEGKLGSTEIRGKLNGGGNLLTIHTGDGSIQLQKLRSTL
jgi:Putative adhesin